MFARWSQENFFKYAREEYGLDKLVSYQIEDIPDGTIVVNPVHREYSSKLKSKAAVLSRKKAQFGALSLVKEISEKNVGEFEKEKIQLKEEIESIESTLKDLKGKRSTVAKHIKLSELPKEEQFKRLSVHSKHFIDTIKMIAYRSETAMGNVLREKMTNPNEHRSVLKAIYQNEVDIIPDYEKGRLTVSLHHLANKINDEAIEHLCDELNLTETKFPGTNLQIFYKLGTGQNPRGQEV